MVDEDGFRPNVGVILTNKHGRVFWAKRTEQNAWQFPQGGINPMEDLETAMFRELNEETGLEPGDVRIIECTQGWLRYRLPQRLMRHENRPVCIGQKQKWFLLKLTGEDSHIQLDRVTPQEFDNWCWVSYWYPLSQIVNFKREVYRRALKELAPAWIQLQEKS